MATPYVASQSAHRTSPEAEIASLVLARDVIPPVAASGVVAVVALALRQTNPRAALRIARFLNLMLASLLTGNGVGGARFVHPALRSLPPRGYLEAEQAITRRYPGAMLAMMPTTVATGVLTLSLVPRRRGRSFWLTLAGTLGFVGVFATTLAELPLNRQTLRASPDAPETWSRSRPRWDQFNLVRTLLEVGGWSLLCLGALEDNS